MAISRTPYARWVLLPALHWGAFADGELVIFGASRKSTNEPFTNGWRHPTSTGLAEASTLTGDDSTKYYHCQDMSTRTWEVCVTRRR